MGEAVRVAGMILVVLYGMAGIYVILLFQSWRRSFAPAKRKKGVRSWKTKIKR